MRAWRFLQIFAPKEKEKMSEKERKKEIDCNPAQPCI
jgi:hypothetical protein